MGRFKMRGRLGRALRKIKPARFLRGFAADVIPGAGMVLDSGLLGDIRPGKGGARRATKVRGARKVKRAVRKMKKKGGGPGLGAMGGALADRAGGILGQLRGGNLAGALGTGILGTGKSLRGFGGGSRRRMNVGNTKALRRSVRRVEAFAKLAKKTIHMTQAVKLKTHRKGRR
jgi:hypothetical protein